MHPQFTSDSITIHTYICTYTHCPTIYMYCHINQWKKKHHESTNKQILFGWWTVKTTVQLARLSIDIAYFAYPEGWVIQSTTTSLTTEPPCLICNVVITSLLTQLQVRSYMHEKKRAIVSNCTPWVWNKTCPTILILQPTCTSSMDICRQIF